MWHAVVLTAGLAIGLYAGKKRARGKTWCEVTVDLSKDAWRNTVSVWNKVSWPFRREKSEQAEKAEKADGSGAIEPEVV